MVPGHIESKVSKLIGSIPSWLLQLCQVPSSISLHDGLQDGRRNKSFPPHLMVVEFITAIDSKLGLEARVLGSLLWV